MYCTLKNLFYYMDTLLLKFHLACILWGHKKRFYDHLKSSNRYYVCRLSLQVKSPTKITVLEEVGLLIKLEME